MQCTGNSSAIKLQGVNDNGDDLFFQQEHHSVHDMPIAVTFNISFQLKLGIFLKVLFWSLAHYDPELDLWT